MDRMLGPRLSKTSLARCEGIMSVEQVVGLMRETVVDKQERDIGWKWHRMAVGKSGMRWAVGVDGILDLMVATLLIRNVRKTSQVLWEASRLAFPAGVRI